MGGRRSRPVKGGLARPRKCVDQVRRPRGRVLHAARVCPTAVRAPLGRPAGVGAQCARPAPASTVPRSALPLSSAVSSKEKLRAGDQGIQVSPQRHHPARGASGRVQRLQATARRRLSVSDFPPQVPSS
ncbi:hypothetical protein NDU88_004857 [Pleurodeles waltl]|uniref:Uncharacterized protein n=1 Tax=Pleurodeles waltl TaxID=8319 RepID=A0AAV7NM99_PLEWA|nr:hypothetical protein NDU88_004857 [Pleurodeles waltl]